MSHWHIELTTLIGPWATFLEPLNGLTKARNSLGTWFGKQQRRYPFLRIGLNLSNAETIMPDIAKTCPKCTPDRLVVRVNGDTGEDFLGCENWPECRYTEPLPLDMQLRRAGVAPLPGF